MDISDPHDPTARAIRNLIDVDGGPLAPGTFGSTLYNEDLLHLIRSITFLEETLNVVSSTNGGPAASVHLTRSPGMGATVRMVNDAHAAILVPVGTIARMQVMHRLLLTNWNRDGRPVEVMASVMDQPRQRAVPSGLAPLLGDLRGEGDWWQAIDALDATITLDPTFAPDVAELNHLSVSLLLSHEFAHVLRRHHEVRRKVRAGELAFEVGDGQRRRPATDAELARAIECDADLVAAYLVVVTLVKQVDGAGERGWLPRGFLRLAYALTALLALFDPERLSLLEYGDESAYPHPLIRYSAYMDYIRDAARQTSTSDAYDQGADFGAGKCLEGLAWLETDIMTAGRFGGPGADSESPIHPLRPSTAFTQELAKVQDEQRALALRLGTLITDHFGEFKLAAR